MMSVYDNVKVPILIDRYDAELYRLQELLAGFMHSGKAYNATIAQKIVATYNILSQALTKNFKGIEHSDYNQPDYQCYQAMQMNVFQFSAAKQIHLAQQMNTALLNNNGVRRSFADFKKHVDKMGVTYDVNYLNTEYNFATTVGQNAANYWRQQADKKNIPFVQYQTMGDSRVRDTHQILNGKIFSLDDPFLSRIYPPNGWGCRCELVQYPQGSASNASQAANLLNQANIKPEFQINRAIAKEVFSQNQAYLKTIANTDIEKLNDLSYSDYNRPATIKGNSSLGKLKEVTPEFDKNNKAVYKDYFGRQVVLDKDNYSSHTQGKYLQENRHLYASKIQGVLEHPTEVYLKYYNNQPSMRYIKYYDDGTSLIVQTGFENDTHIVGTWFKNDKGNENRQGYLIKYSNE